MFINSANASTLAGGSGWRVASTVANGIGVTVSGAKDIIVNGAKKTVTGVANVTPTAGQVGKFLAKNGSAAAVVGVVDLLLDGVDWVMDPANNTVKFHEKVQDQKCDATSCASLLNIFQINNYTNVGTFSTIEAAATHYAEKIMSGVKNREAWTCSQILWNTYRCEAKAKNEAGYNISVGIDIVQVSNPNYDQSKEEDRKKTVPLSDIGQQVIDLAETEVKTGNPAIAVPVTQAAATAVVGEAATDETQARPIVTELDKSASIPTTETAEGTITQPTTDTTTGEVKPGSISLDFPVFCSWAPSMCVMADNVQQAIADAREWVKESEVTDTELDFPEVDQQETDTDINFNASCPASIKLASFNYHGKQQDWEVDFQDWCHSVTTYIRPIVISMGAYFAVLIVSGVRINE